MNPLSGLRIPSLSDIAEYAVSMFGKSVLDLSHPLQRDRLRKAIESSLRMSLDRFLQPALLQAQEKAIKHVIRLMQDVDYQHKKTIRLKGSRERRKKRREEIERDLAAKARTRLLDVKPIHGKVIVQ
jgi:hypothetical protein